MGRFHQDEIDARHRGTTHATLRLNRPFHAEESRPSGGVARLLRALAPAVLLLPLLLLACSGDDDPAAPLDITPPAQIDDLSAQVAGDGVVLLIWTAPGDDRYAGRAHAYELRRHDTVITLAVWDSAEVITGLPAPSASGQRDSMRVSGLRVDWVHHFALRAIDEAGNQGRLSVDYSFYLPPPDGVPPSAITDLEVVAVTSSTVRLAWPAPGDDGEEGTSARYMLRYTTGSLDEATWAEADSAEISFTPYPSGQAEEYTVRGLAAATRYEFGLKAIDEAGNESSLSNVVFARTANE